MRVSYLLSLGSFPLSLEDPIPTKIIGHLCASNASRIPKAHPSSSVTGCRLSIQFEGKGLSGKPWSFCPLFHLCSRLSLLLVSITMMSNGQPRFHHHDWPSLTSLLLSPSLWRLNPTSHHLPTCRRRLEWHRWRHHLLLAAAGLLGPWLLRLLLSPPILEPARVQPVSKVGSAVVDAGSLAGAAAEESSCLGLGLSAGA